MKSRQELLFGTNTPERDKRPAAVVRELKGAAEEKRARRRARNLELAAAGGVKPFNPSGRKPIQWRKDGWRARRRTKKAGGLRASR